MSILGKIFDTTMVTFYVVFCLIGGLAAFRMAAEGEYGVAMVSLAFTTFMLVKVNPWRSSVALPHWLTKAVGACGRVTDRAADALERKTRALGKALWIGLILLFFFGVVPALVITAFFAWPVVCLLLVVIFVLLSIFKVLVLQAEKEARS